MLQCLRLQFPDDPMHPSLMLSPLPCPKHPYLKIGGRGCCTRNPPGTLTQCSHGHWVKVVVGKVTSGKAWPEHLQWFLKTSFCIANLGINTRSRFCIAKLDIAGHTSSVYECAWFVCVGCNTWILETAHLIVALFTAPVCKVCTADL